MLGGLPGPLLRDPHPTWGPTLSRGSGAAPETVGVGTPSLAAAGEKQRTLGPERTSPRRSSLQLALVGGLQSLPILQTQDGGQRQPLGREGWLCEISRCEGLGALPQVGRPGP